MSLMELLGPTAVPTIILLVFGFVMLVIEMFHPGIGAAGFLGVLSLIAVAVLQFGWGNPRVALYIVAITLLVIILGIIWLIRSMQRGKLSKSFLVLREQSDGASVPEVASARQDLVDKTGVAISALRPSGIAEIDGRRVDVLATGAFLEKGTRVRVVKAEGMHILVQADDESAQ